MRSWDSVHLVLDDDLEDHGQEVRGWAALKAGWMVLTPIVAGVVVVVAGYLVWQAAGRVFGPVAGILHHAALFGINLPTRSPTRSP